MISFKQLFPKWCVCGLWLLAMIGGNNFVHAQPKLSLQVATDWTSIQVGEPVVCCARLKNESELPATVSKEFSCIANKLQFEAIAPGKEESQRIPAVSQGVSWPYIAAFVELSPGKERITWEMLVPSERYRFFDRPGIWTLRAVLIESPHVEAISSPLRILVQDSQEKTSELRLKAAMLIHTAITSQLAPTSTKLADLEAAYAELPAGKLKDVVGWLVALVRVRDSNSRESFAAARSDADKIYHAAGDVSKLWIADLLTKQYVNIPDWKLAEREVEKLPLHSDEYYRLRLQIRDRRENR